MSFRITYDAAGTPGIWADDAPAAYGGLGFLHGLHRPLQTLLLATAARGELAGRLLPRADLVALDALAHRLDLPARGRAGAERLERHAAELVDAYIDGVRRGLLAGGRPLELAILGARPAPPDRASILSGLLLCAYLGLAESQERMERALVEALVHGADPSLLSRLFAPQLDGWAPARVRGAAGPVPLGFAAYRRLGAVGGSNAWAVTGERSRSGAALLAGDPHLQIDQLPSVLFEVRARFGESWWLGASIAGLPGLAVGRNRHLAWSGTFSVADNVDFTIETLEKGRARRGDRWEPLVERQVEIRLRLRPPLRLSFLNTDRGVLERNAEGDVLAASWAAGDRPAEALAAYLRLPLATSVDEADRLLAGAHALSLHFVLADRSGAARWCQAGAVPKRSAGWSGLYPVPPDRGRWLGLYAPLPRAAPTDGIVASANESGPAQLATLAQPTYRLDRIRAQLGARRDHDVASFAALQLDRVSLQARRLLPRFLPHVTYGPLRAALAGWAGTYSGDSVAPHAFELCYDAALDALAADLGGDWMRQLLATSEARVWWCAAIDRLLDDTAFWASPRGAAAGAAIGAVAREPVPWSELRRFTLRNLLLGGSGLGFDRGPYELPGCIATVQQGNLVPAGDRHVAIGPAYRFVTDLGEDAAFTALPGGIDGSRFSRTYDRWLTEWRDGRLHRIAPPDDGERT